MIKMIDKDKLIRELENKINNKIYYISANTMLNNLKNGYYDAKTFHDVDKFYKK
jgi:hypothetical protein